MCDSSNQVSWVLLTKLGFRHLFMMHKAMTIYLDPDSHPYECEIVIPILLKVVIYIEPEVLEMPPSCEFQTMQAESEQISIPEPQPEQSEDHDLTPIHSSYWETAAQNNLVQRSVLQVQALLRSLAVKMSDFLTIFRRLFRGRFA